jgi:hypothetical protein
MNTKIALTDTATRERLIQLYSEWAQTSDACAPNLPTTAAALARVSQIEAEIATITTQVTS